MPSTTKSRPKLVSVEVLEEPTITSAHVEEAEAATRSTLSALMAEPLEKVYVPGNLSISGIVEVLINGTRFSFPQKADYEMPASVAALVRTRIAAVESSNPK